MCVALGVIGYCGFLPRSCGVSMGARLSRVSAAQPEVALWLCCRTLPRGRARAASHHNHFSFFELLIQWRPLIG